MKVYYVYILASRPRGTLYVGVTNNLMRRVKQHKDKIVPGFTEKYGVDKLVYFQGTNNISGALIREKRLKKWNREWKIRMIENFNPEWQDLYYPILDGTFKDPRDIAFEEREKRIAEMRSKRRKDQK